MEGYREHNTILWILELEDSLKEEEKRHQCIRNDGNDQHINAVLPEIDIQYMLEFLTRALFIPVKSTLLRAVKNVNFVMWSILMDNNINKFLARSESSVLVHMYQSHKNNGTYILWRRRCRSDANITAIISKIYLCDNGRHRYWKSIY